MIQTCLEGTSKQKLSMFAVLVKQDVTLIRTSSLKQVFDRFHEDYLLYETHENSKHQSTNPFLRPN
jgi:hypothetical protein